MQSTHQDQHHLRRFPDESDLVVPTFQCDGISGLRPAIGCDDDLNHVKKNFKAIRMTCLLSTNKTQGDVAERLNV